MPSTHEPIDDRVASPLVGDEQEPFQPFSDRWILRHRPPKNLVDPNRPYAYVLEKERTLDGRIADVATIFLTNRECPFRCLMCDLWKNTTDQPVALGAIPTQIRWALQQLSNVASPLVGDEENVASPLVGGEKKVASPPRRDRGEGVEPRTRERPRTVGDVPAQQIKLYNSGNFFDPHAIPPADYPKIAELVSGFDAVVVESHPRLVGRRCLAFNDMVRGQVHVAMGLETVHPDVLPRLNKRMTLQDFARATETLRKHQMPVRAFLLLPAPFLSESEGVVWAKRSLDFAFDVGVECCVVIPTRGGNGAMEVLAQQGRLQPPTLDAIEEVLVYGVSLQRGRVFADLWDIDKVSGAAGHPTRVERLHRINFTQSVEPNV